MYARVKCVCSDLMHPWSETESEPANKAISHIDTQEVSTHTALKHTKRSFAPDPPTPRLYNTNILISYVYLLLGLLGLD